MVPPQFGHSLDASVLVGCFLSILLTSSRGLVIRLRTRLPRVIIRRTIRRRTGMATIATDIECSIVIEGYKVCTSKTDTSTTTSPRDQERARTDAWEKHQGLYGLEPAVRAWIYSRIVFHMVKFLLP